MARNASNYKIIMNNNQKNACLELVCIVGYFRNIVYKDTGAHLSPCMQMWIKIKQSKTHIYKLSVSVSYVCPSKTWALWMESCSESHQIASQWHLFAQPWHHNVTIYKYTWEFSNFKVVQASEKVSKSAWNSRFWKFCHSSWCYTNATDVSRRPINTLLESLKAKTLLELKWCKRIKYLSN